MQFRPREVLVSASAVIIGLSACGSAALPESEQAQPAETVAAENPAAAAPVQTVSGPVFETVDGGQFDLNSLEGTDTVLWFWAPW